MKSIKNNDGKVSRVADEKAYDLVNKGTHTFCPKDEWKKQEKLGKYAPPKKTNKNAK
jgi:hypothetical protein